MLDTNAVIGLLKNADPVLAARAREHSVQAVCISSIVAHELYFGAYKSRRREENLARIGAIRFETISFDKEDAESAAELRASLAAQGAPVGPYDVLIAGQARARGLILVTNNVREFRRVERLTVEDWTETPGPARET